MRMMRIFARVILATPLVLVALGLLFMIIPGASTVVSNIFWSVLGEINIFAVASTMLQNGLSYQTVDVSMVATAYLQLMAAEILNALLLGSCVFLAKALGSRFTNKQKVLFYRPEWQLTIIGVLIGVALVAASDFSAGAASAALKGGVTIGILLFGIWKMLTAGSSYSRGGTYHRRRNRFIVNLLLGVLGNAFSAICGVYLLTCVMEGPRFVKLGGSFAIWIVWLLLGVVLMVLCDMVIDLLKGMNATENAD